MAEDLAIGKALVIPQDVLNKIDEVDKKINQIATDSEKMAEKYSSAIKKMSLNSDSLLKKLTDMQTKINNIDVSKFAQGVSNVSKGTIQIEKFATAISKAAAAINKYNSNKLNQKNIDNTKEINNLKKEIDALKKKTEQLERYRQKQREVNQEQNNTRINTKAIDAYNRAMASSEALVTQRINKIAKLRQAEEMLTQSGGKYESQIKRIRSEIERLNKLNQGQVDAYGKIIKSHSNLMNTSDQLMRKLALIFSVSQIQGYLMNMVKVRGEFELQNTALASILQNKDQADKLFAQITELAVKSPFTLKELTTYTKSLSAYQVEYEKLYDTTKMLADVSAGLGVDMQRLILAFGQVKAANFLRGTETRQFTEAGINMLGELAKYYSELEERMVSIGEVQERQFKRMISFQDVEAVFKRLTSAGGMFYNMQEKQAETLAGMMSNLQDSIDIMLNDIGKGNESVIKDMIKNVRSIIENWREVAWYLEKIATAFVVYKGAAMLAALGNNAFVKSLFQLNKTSIPALRNIAALKSSLFSLGRGIATAGIVFLVSWLVDLYRQATKTSRELKILGEELDKITSIDSSNVEKLVSSLDDLIARFKLSNEGTQERRDIISSINSSYGEYLNFVVDETTSIKDLTNAYDGVIKKIKEKAALSTLEKGYQEINKFYEDNLTEARKEFEKELSRGLTTDLGFGGFRKSIKPTKDEINDLFNILQVRIKQTDKNLLDTSREQRNLLQEIVKDYYGQQVTLSQDYLKTVSLIDLFIQRKEKEEDLQNKINGAYKETLKSREANIALTERENQLTLDKESINKMVLSPYETKKRIQEAVEKFELDKIDIKVKFGEISEAEGKRQKDAILNWATNTVKDVNNRIREELKGYSDEDLSKVLIGKEEQATGLSTIQQTVKQNWETQVKTIEQLTTLKNINISIDEKLLENAQKLKIMYEAKARALGVELESKKESNRSDNSELNKLKDQISLLKKAGEEYDKLIKTYSSDEANRIIRDSYKDVFSNLSLSTTMTFDTDGIIEGMRALQYQTIEGGKEVVDKAIADLTSEKSIKVGVEGLEEIQNQIDGIFKNYEFSLELQSAGIDPDAFKDMLKNLGASDAEISLVGLDATTFEEAAKKVRDIISDLQKDGGEKNLELARKYQEQLTQLEVKEARKRFDELYKLREKYQSNEEKILKAQSSLNTDKNELAVLESMKASGVEVNREQEELLKLRIKAGEDAILQLKSEALQLTDFWQKLFGDLNDISVNSLVDLSRITEEIISNRKEIRGDNGETKGYSSSYTDKDGIKRQVTLTQQQYQRLLKQNNQVADEVKKKNPFLALYQAILKGKNEGETQLDYYTRLEGILSDVSNAAFQTAGNLLDIFGANDEAKEMLNSIKGIADGAVNLGMGVAKITSGDIIGGGMSAISGIASIVTSITKIGDKKKEKEIERQIELVEELQHKYENLEDAINSAYSLDTLSAGTKQMNENLKEQNKALEKAIAAEEDKKDTDSNRIKDYQQQIEANQKQIEENNKSLIESLGGFGTDDSVKSAAEEFAQAWLDAYLEVGNGLDGLQEKMDDWINNAIQKQILTQLSSKYITPILEEFNRMFTEGSIGGQIMTGEELAAWQKLYDTKSEQFNEAAEAYIEALKQAGINIGGTSGEGMSGLSQSIQGITESQADALSAITESIRYFASDSNTVLRNIYNWIINPPVESPLFAEMKLQTQQLRLMYSLWNSMSTTKGGVAGRVMKVQMV